MSRAHPSIHVEALKTKLRRMDREIEAWLLGASDLEEGNVVFISHIEGLTPYKVALFWGWYDLGFGIIPTTAEKVGMVLLYVAHLQDMRNKFNARLYKTYGLNQATGTIWDGPKAPRFGK